MAKQTWFKAVLAFLSLTVLAGSAFSMANPNIPSGTPKPTSAMISNVSGIVKSGTTLKNGDYVRSPSDSFFLVMQSDGNLVLYPNKPYNSGHAVWASGTFGHSGAVAVMQTDGNLVVYAGGKAIFNTGTYGSPGAALAVKDDGTIGVYLGIVPLWSSKGGITMFGTSNAVKTTTAVTPYLVRGGELFGAPARITSQNGQYFLAMQGDGNLVLYTSSGHALWASNTAGNPGAWMIMQGAGNLVVYSAAPYRALWASYGSTHPGAFLIVQNDGNLVIYDGGTVLWQSGTAGGASVLRAPAPPAPAPPASGGGGGGDAWNPNDGTGVTYAEYLAWSKVNVCEEGGNWHVQGASYPGGLGISATNWAAYGGQARYGSEAAATPDQQIAIAKRIQANPPDQNGCNPGGW